MVPAPPPLFHGKPVLATYAPDVRNARNLAAGIAGTVKYATDHHMEAPALIERVVDMGRSYKCVIQLVANTPEAIEFSVTRAEQTF